MATSAKLNVILTASAGAFEAALGRASRELNTFRSNVGAATAPLRGVTGSLAALTGVTLGAGTALVGLSRSLELAGDAEQATIAFETFTGSAETAAKVLGELRDFAASTPFQLPELRDAASKLLAFGTTADAVVPTLRRLGDLAAGTGQPIGELAELLGKAQVQGRLFGEDINQFTGRGIPILQEFAKQFGVSAGEVKKLVETGKIGFPELEKALIDLTDTGGRFAGLTAKQSQSVVGLWSTAKDEINAALTDIGATLIRELDLKQVLKDTTQWISENRAAIVEWAKELAGAAGQVAKLIVQLAQLVGKLAEWGRSLPGGADWAGAGAATDGFGRPLPATPRAQLSPAPPLVDAQRDAAAAIDRALGGGLGAGAAAGAGAGADKMIGEQKKSNQILRDLLEAQRTGPALQVADF